MYANMYGEENLLIRSFEVQGLTRTKLSVIEPYYRHYEGRPYAEFSAEKLVQDLRKLGIFDTGIQIFPKETRGEDGAWVDIIIVVEEKWTLLPFPFATTTSSGNRYGGLAVFETNLLGYNKKMYALGLLSNKGWRGVAGYMDPALFGSAFEYDFTVSGGVNETLLVKERNESWHNYETMDAGIRSGFSWKASQTISAGFALGFLERSVNKDFESRFPLLPPPDSARFLRGAFSLRYDDLYYASILVYGLSFRAQYEHNFSLLADFSSYGQYDANIHYQIEVFDGHRLGFAASGMYVAGAPLVMENNIGGSILKTLPDDFIADAVVGGQASFEYIIFRFFWGALTAQAGYEAGVFSLDDSSPSYAHGPGGGIRVYLAKIALPAFGIDVYYNVKTGKPKASMYMGLSF
jgi:hypothetical protein